MQPSNLPSQDKNSYEGSQGFRNKSWKIYLHYCSRILGVLLFVAAIYVVQKEFKHLSIKEIKTSLKEISSFSLLVAGGYTFLSFFILSFYDKLAVKQVGDHLSFWKTAFASFCSYVLSHNIGFSAVSGAMVRFRLYGSWGLKPIKILQIIAFCSVTYVLGVAVLVGGLLIFKSSSLPIIGQAFPSSVFMILGIMGWLGVALYVLISFRCDELKIGKYNFSLPSPLTVLAQIIVATIEVIVTAAIPYCIVPSHTELLAYPQLDFLSFLAIYIASYMAGLIASVPGGAGVFEGSMLLGLKAYMPITNIMCIIFVFRLFYYLIPLFFAGIMFAGHEMLMKGEKIIQNNAPKKAKAVSKQFIVDNKNIRESDAAFSVNVAATAVFVCAVMVLVIPLLDPMTWYSNGSFSLAVEIIGDYLLSFFGMILLPLAIALSRRITIAWRLSLLILVILIVITVMRGVPLFIPVTLTLVTFFIAPFRNCYYRTADFCVAPLSVRTIIDFILFLSAMYITLWIGPQSIAQDGILQVFLSSEVTLQVKLLVASVGLLGLIILFKMMLPAKIKFWKWTDETAQLYQVINRITPMVPLTIKPDYILICSTQGTAIPFIRKKGFLIGIRDPVGNEREIINTIWRLRDLATEENRSIAFWNVSTQYLPVYQDLGLVSIALHTHDRFVCCEMYDVKRILQTIKETKLS